VLAGKPLIVPGDGTSLWVVTHNTDFAKGFVGLMGHPRAVGQAYHITTDEVTSWDALYTHLGDALAAPAKLVHIASDWLIRFDPSTEGSLLGDKSCSVAFDNAKIKAAVPDFRATTSVRDTVHRCVQWFRENPSAQLVDAKLDEKTDRAIAQYERSY
jgi:nucleoside-diphosphate-sugar epimerase